MNIKNEIPFVVVVNIFEHLKDRKKIIKIFYFFNSFILKNTKNKIFILT